MIVGAYDDAAGGGPVTQGKIYLLVFWAYESQQRRDGLIE
ncbi:hypothetical protein V7x_26220 [Crateriforma conspicua]|uniref:Uncharacterized protein n=1 Tax=Crateriforma conspicua TaxID=2527996 RepID=A0A5C6G0N7_9PLAN|nr:hypothetical protein V7x_26220 [Crateriforma conspicua]